VNSTHSSQRREGNPGCVSVSVRALLAREIRLLRDHVLRVGTTDEATAFIALLLRTGTSSELALEAARLSVFPSP
jgi:hypothetical protein